MKKLLVLSLMLASSLSFAGGDRINNGGAVWACENNNQVVYDYMFMDVYEGRRERHLTLPEINITAPENVQMQKNWILKHLKDGRAIVEQIEYVEKNITWIDEVLTLIPDSENRISPQPATCPDGTWRPVQLVNFTDDKRVLVRRDIFNSPFLTELDRSAVYLHEGFYSYLRITYGDANSIRARALTAFVLSNESDAKKLTLIQDSLSQKVPDPVTEKLGWICGIKPGRDTALYTSISKDKNLATNEALKSCIEGEDPFKGGIPGFPNAFPLPIPSGWGPERECQAGKVYCEEIKSQARNSKCILNDFFDRKVAEGVGRTKLEAKQETIRQCLADTGDQNTCYRAEKITCQ